MLQLDNEVQSRVSRQLVVQMATTQQEVRAAQALRYRVFAEEMGARLRVSEPGLDQDLFDNYCEHLIALDDATGEVVGTYRILSPQQARKVGSFYSDTEFDLIRLASLRSQMVEIGRSCVHPDYRNGATIGLLWSGLAQYMQKTGYQYLMGCASVPMGDGGHFAASLYQKLSQKYLASADRQVMPRCALPIQSLNRRLDVETPALLRAYLRAGAKICGTPAWDPDFNTADFLILLSMKQLNDRHVKHFMKNGQ